MEYQYLSLLPIFLILLLLISLQKKRACLFYLLFIMEYQSKKIAELGSDALIFLSNPYSAGKNLECMQQVF